MDCANALVWTHYGRLAGARAADEGAAGMYLSAVGVERASDDSGGVPTYPPRAALSDGESAPVGGSDLRAVQRADAFKIVYALVSQFPEWDAALMMRIGACESGLRNIRSHNVNDDGLYDWGVFQIHGEPEALDPVYATERAYEKWQASGYEPWKSSASCWNLEAG
jgi:hypothetical protein